MDTKRMIQLFILAFTLFVGTEAQDVTCDWMNRPVCQDDYALLQCGYNLARKHSDGDNYYVSSPVWKMNNKNIDLTTSQFTVSLETSTVAVLNVSKVSSNMTFSCFLAKRVGVDQSNSTSVYPSPLCNTSVIAFSQKIGAKEATFEPSCQYMCTLGELQHGNYTVQVNVTGGATTSVSNYTAVNPISVMELNRMTDYTVNINIRDNTNNFSLEPIQLMLTTAALDTWEIILIAVLVGLIVMVAAVLILVCCIVGPLMKRRRAKLNQQKNKVIPGDGIESECPT